jgi:hypothetical protein
MSYDRFHRIWSSIFRQGLCEAPLLRDVNRVRTVIPFSSGPVFGGIYCRTLKSNCELPSLVHQGWSSRETQAGARRGRRSAIHYSPWANSVRASPRQPSASFSRYSASSDPIHATPVHAPLALGRLAPPPEETEVPLLADQPGPFDKLANPGQSCNRDCRDGFSQRGTCGQKPEGSNQKGNRLTNAQA